MTLKELDGQSEKIGGWAHTSDTIQNLTQSGSKTLRWELNYKTVRTET